MPFILFLLPRNNNSSVFHHFLFFFLVVMVRFGGCLQLNREDFPKIDAQNYGKKEFESGACF